MGQSFSQGEREEKRVNFLWGEIRWVNSSSRKGGMEKMLMILLTFSLNKVLVQDIRNDFN